MDAASLSNHLTSVNIIIQLLEDSKNSPNDSDTSEIELLKKSKLFDVKWYSSRYQDVADSQIDPIKHYVLYGIMEGRIPFEWLDYPVYADIFQKCDSLLTLLNRIKSRLEQDILVSIGRSDAIPDHPKNRIKAIIFDMDGVLIEAKEWHYESLNRALGLFGYEISRYDHLSRYDGLPTMRKLKMLSTEHSRPQELHRLINALKQKYTMEIIHTRCKPTFEHEYALSNLKRLGYKLGVASNSVRFSVEMMMKYSCLDQYLDVLLSNEDVSQPKPDPEIYLKAMAALDMSPEQCMIVEDNENGIAAARASGAKVMVVKDTRDVNLANIMQQLQTEEVLR